MRFYLLAITFIGASVFGYDFPILEKRVGGLDKRDGVSISKSCQIFDNNSKIKLDEVLKNILKAEKEPLRQGTHERQEVPSIEIFANYPMKKAVGPATTALVAHKVLLLQDSSTLNSRDGKASEELLRTVEELCKNL